ncbi:MAG: DUF4852 domain-containing protein [Legionellales bacterium]|nr:DUF4852 domain-containing protein [Legionellales bacterium]
MKNYRIVLVSVALALTACSKGSAPKAENLTPSTHPSDGSKVTSQQPQATIQSSSLPNPDPGVSFEKYQTITSGNQLMFIYYALSGMPVDYKQIASNYSVDYRSTQDEFKKNDILNSLKPTIDSNIANAKNNRYLVWTIDNTPLSHYDFSSKSFTTQQEIPTNSSYGYYQDVPQYHITFTNAKNYTALRVSDESLAKKIESMVSNPNSLFSLKIYAFAQGVDLSNRTVNCLITKVELFGKPNIYDAKSNDALLFTQQ